MNKILTFIVNEYNEILLLKGSPNDPQFKKTFWYVVTGGYEENDKNLKNTVKREVAEETGLTVNESLYLNWIFKYKSLGNLCTEYVYISFVNKNGIILNEENIEYKWCNIEDFIKEVHWFGDKKILRSVLKLALERKVYFTKEKIDMF